MTEKIIRIGDVQLWTESLGNPEHSPVLLIMGANASAMYWPDEFVALLIAGKRRVIRYDHRDTGRSTARSFAKHPYSIADLANDAVAVLDGYGIERAHVVGLSMGGTIGQVLAVDHRERLLSLTVMITAALDVDFVRNSVRALNGERSIDGLPTPDPSILQFFARRSEPGSDKCDKAAEIAFRLQTWRALSGDQLPFVEDDFRRWEERAIAHAGTHVLPRVHAFVAPFPTARGAELKGITTPTLVIQGSADPLNPPPHGRHLADAIPSARFAEIPGMGHALITGVHQVIADLILDHTS
jgi:10-carbomethoxy-13-deoxycarminomycin esterase/esterase